MTSLKYKQHDDGDGGGDLKIQMDVTNRSYTFTRTLRQKWNRGYGIAIRLLAFFFVNNFLLAKNSVGFI